MKKKQLPKGITPAQILQNPLFNKGTAFTTEERSLFHLDGTLPPHISSLEEQLKRTYLNFQMQNTEIAKFTFLNSLYNRNEILFYRFILEHVEEVLPFIYTPTVGLISSQYSLLYREARGLYLSCHQQDKLDSIFANVQRNISVIVVTDGERILGLGDLGIGGMAISTGKLFLYTLFGGIHPENTLPIVLDVGTNNKSLLEDPLYLGNRHPRITGEKYDLFLENFVQAVKKHFPQVLLQWEDFARDHAQELLKRYETSICSFNDDIQGTAAVALAALYNAAFLTKSKLRDQRIVLFGGGGSGMAICNQIVEAIVDESNISIEAARKQFFVIDQEGLLHQGLSSIRDNQKNFTHPQDVLKGWVLSSPGRASLLETVQNVKPTILIGVSTVQNAFTEDVVKEMSKHVPLPTILPLSNPSTRCEAHPEDLIKWTQGRVITASGSPFEPVQFNNKTYSIAQCNNVYIFPGVGLGLIASQVQHAPPEVFIEAAKTLSAHSPIRQDPSLPLFPPLTALKQVSREIALSVVRLLIKKGLVEEKISPEELVDKVTWTPEYPSYYQ